MQNKKKFYYWIMQDPKAISGLKISSLKYTENLQGISGFKSRLKTFLYFLKETETEEEIDWDESSKEEVTL